MGRRCAERPERAQADGTVLELRGKHGLSTILKGTDFVPGATTRERNQQIGGHQA